MIEDNKDEPQTVAVDDAMMAELEGVPASMLEGGDEDDADAKLDEALAKLRSDMEAAQQDALYARAEIQNVRRRLEKEKEDARNYAATGFARDMLSVSDNLGRALEAIPAELRDDERLKSFITGIEATQRELDKVFTQNGIQRIAAVGLPLDPNLHQAMMEVPAAEGQEPGTIAAELQAGYTIKDRLLRPAMVTVAK